MVLETLKITGLESKPYAVREWIAQLFGEEPEPMIYTKKENLSTNKISINIF